MKENWKNQRELTKILFAGMKARTELREPQGPQMGEKERPKRQALKKDQCAYCKEQRHWKNECPKRDSKRGTTQRERISPGTQVLYVGGRQRLGESRLDTPLRVLGNHTFGGEACWLHGGHWHPTLCFKSKTGTNV